MQALRLRPQQQQQRVGQQQASRPAAAPALLRNSNSSRKYVVKASAQKKDGYKVVIVGGGSAGATVAAHYARTLPPGQVAVIDPSAVHFYQPLWTLVGGGFKDVSESARPMAEVLPLRDGGAEWLQTGVAEFDPAANLVRTTDGRTVGYEWLVVATGLQINWGQVKGLPEALGDGRVVSNMSARTAPLTAKAVAALAEGHAVFTMPKGAVKCPGAGHKVCYIAEDAFRRRGVRGDVSVTLAMAADKIFGVPRYAETISRLVAARGIDVQLRHNLVEVNAAAREAVFEELAPGGGPPTGAVKVLKYDLLHVTPPQGPLGVVAASPLANAEGWVDVDTKVCVCVCVE
jgi:sulfide:quinone oxidoreductase